MKLKDLYKPNQSDKGAVEMSYPNYMKNRKVGGKTKTRKEKVVVRDSKTGRVYGMRTVIQKDT
jgi:hypothetical protein